MRSLFVTKTLVEIAPVIRTVEVVRSCADAFRIFTEETSAWWPHSYTRAQSSRGQAPVAVTIEPEAGGRVFETLGSGEELDWGEVLIFEPASRFTMRFWIGMPEATAGTVDVRFEALGSGRCRVTLTHDGWERMGEKGIAARERFVPGWTAVFDHGFGAHVGLL
jgi:hypothetical protein